MDWVKRLTMSNLKEKAAATIVDMLLNLLIAAAIIAAITLA